MKQRKQRIAEFVESVKGENITNSTIILGGAKNDSYGLNSTKNSTSCSNGTYDGCNKSENGGDCVNNLGMCNNSTNRGKCDNQYQPVKNDLCMCGS